MDKTNVIRKILENGELIINGDDVFLKIGSETFVVPTKDYYNPTEDAKEFRRKVIRTAQIYFKNPYDQILYIQSWPLFYGFGNHEYAIAKLRDYVKSLIDEGANTLIYVVHVWREGNETIMQYYAVQKYAPSKVFVMRSNVVERVTSSGVVFEEQDNKM